jgi:hypothetical protein
LPGWTGEECDSCVFRVDGGASGDPENGLSWATAFGTVEDAVSVAASALGLNPGSYRCHVWIAAGTYHVYESATSDTLLLKPGVQLYGGFEGTETSLDQRDIEANPTVLDGASESDDGLRVLHVVTAATGTRIDGLTITHGRADGEEEGGRGGGVFSLASEGLEVSGCLFSANEAALQGSAVYAAGGSVSIEDTAFTGNSCTTLGGALGAFQSEVLVQGCDFSGNTGVYGGAIRFHDLEAVVARTVFSNNTTTEFNAGVYAYGVSLQLRECGFEQNEADWQGGAVGLYEGSDAMIESCSFTGSTATVSGAMIVSDSDASIINSVFDSNSAQEGGALGVYDGSTVTVTNSTFFGNAASSGARWFIVVESAVEVSNSIAWGSVQPTVYSVDGTYSITYSLAAGQSGSGDIGGDPLFVDPDNGDFRLQSGSPCIDAADGDAAPSLDLDGNPRTDDPETPNTGCGTPAYVDMGAFEYQY